MKVLSATLLLLLCACRLRAAVVRRDAPVEEAAPPAVDDFFTRHFQPFSDFVTKDLPQKLHAEELRSQAEAYLDRANKQLAPLAQELQSNVLSFYTFLLELTKGKEQA
ncbi:apolipoprotein A-II [Sarcoramphus papa]